MQCESTNNDVKIMTTVKVQIMLCNNDKCNDCSRFLAQLALHGNYVIFFAQIVEQPLQQGGTAFG